ncbi:hypothetical protein AVEN_65782-1 [Araneus ventricosus]|uniref:Uncharacterized protein n=1 Tax=Araneus ventricosus TaxID=182803 RepID=A0A4Y2MDU9_ARAVE|nr:hypothetical protein AVEN_65782-1 [Araneus ventricosus]
MTFAHSKAVSPSTFFDPARGAVTHGNNTVGHGGPAASEVAPSPVDDKGKVNRILTLTPHETTPCIVPSKKNVEERSLNGASPFLGFGCLQCISE